METLQKAYGPQEHLWTIAVHNGALRCIAETLRKPCGPLECFQIIAVYYDALRCK